jgi:alpha-tubulin suppressor-like RCC1 family protein
MTESRKTILITDLDPDIFAKKLIGNKYYITLPPMSDGNFNSLFRFSIQDLGDVAANIPAENNILIYKDGEWTPSVIDEGLISNLNISLAGLKDVALPADLSINDVLSWNGAKWVAAQPQNSTTGGTSVNQYSPRRIKFFAVSKGQTDGVFAISTDDQIYQAGLASTVYNHLATNSDRLQLCPMEGTKTGTWKKVLYNSQNMFALTTTGELWAKGNNANGQLGNGTTSDTIQDTIKKINFGFALNTSNYSTTDGTLLIEDFDISWSNPISTAESKKVTVIAICKTNIPNDTNRYLFGWGYQSISSGVGANVFAVNGPNPSPFRIYPTLFDNLNSNIGTKTPYKVSLGISGEMCHYIILTKSGEVYTAGGNGITSNINPLGRNISTTALTSVSSLSAVLYYDSINPPPNWTSPYITDVFAGANILGSNIALYSMLKTVSPQDELYYSGLNNIGQAGVGTSTLVVSSGLGAFTVCNYKNLNSVQSPSPIKIKTFGWNDGSFHFAHINTDNRLVTIGGNNQYQLGTSTANVSGNGYYQVLDINTTSNVKRVLTGSYSTRTSQITTSTHADSVSGNTLALFEDGTVWFFGNSKNHQSGVGTNGNFQAQKIILPEFITEIYQSGRDEDTVVFALGSSGRAYTWGANAKGQSGSLPSTTGQIRFPIDVEIPQ